MALREEFWNAIDGAKHKPRVLATGKVRIAKGLHQIIAGPGRSGKTTIAMEYARDLREEGLVKDSEPQRISYRDDITPQQLRAIMNEAMGGVVIFDEIERRNISGSMIARAMAEAIVRGDCVVILVGDPEYIEKLRRDEPMLDSRLPKTMVRTERSLTREEMEKFERDRPARERQHQEEIADRKQRQRLALLEKILDTKTQNDIKPLKQLRLRLPTTENL